MRLSRAIEGFILHKQIEGLSPRTLEGYEHELRCLSSFLDDPHVSDITPHKLRQFFNYLRTDYTPQRRCGDTSPLSPNSIKNFWIALNSFYTWATAELGVSDAMDTIPRPKVPKTSVRPLKPEEFTAMLRACETTRAGRKHADRHRNKAILLVLADTGLRASELCSLTIGDYDSDTGRIDVRSAKGNKSHVVFVCKRTRKALWRALAERDDRHDPNAPLFATRDGRHLSRTWLHGLVSETGDKAGVDNVHPHLIRHFFAIQWLRGGGDIFTLRRALNHSTLEQVRHYCRVADVDVERVHRQASPVDNLPRD